MHNEVYNTSPDSSFVAPRRVQPTWRNVLIGGTTGVAALVSGCADGPKTVPPPIVRTVDIQRSPIVQPRTINDEIALLRGRGFVEDEHERRIWSRDSFVPAEALSLPIEEADKLVRPKLPVLVEQMIDSKNPFISAEGKKMKEMALTNQLRIDTFMTSSRGNKLEASPFYNLDTNRLEYVIRLFLNPLAGEDNQLMAINMVHEMSHVNDFIVRTDALFAQGKTPKQVFDAINPVNYCVDSEATAHAREVQTYILERALDPSLLNKDLEIKTALFLKFGSSENASEWRRIAGERCLR